jgi:C4-dicarboxylate transporter DctM subunit
MIVICLFALLLLLGVPISLVILVSSAAGVVIYADTSLMVAVQQMFNSMSSFVLVAVPFFIMSGNIAARGRIAANLIDLMRLGFGRIRGGSVIASVLACTFFAAISGSSMATVVAIGTIMIPALIKMGYPENMAMGSITAAGSIGMLIPPSAPMVMICVSMGISVGKQFMAGFLPGILLAAVWCVYIYWQCRKLDVRDEKTYTRDEKISVWKNSFFSLLYPLIVLGSIYLGFATPTEAAAIALVYVCVIELFVNRALSLQEIVEECFKALKTSGAIIFIVAAAGVLNWLITTQQVPAMIAGFITENISSKVVFIFLLTGLFFVFGCFMDLIALIIILGPILSPTLAYFGIDPLLFGIIAIMNAQIAYLTAPFGLNLYVTMGLTGQPLLRVFRSVAPYLVLLILVTFFVSFVPPISLFLPGLMR